MFFGFALFEISDVSKIPCATTAENKAQINVIPYVPVMSAICVRILNLYIEEETVPHG